MNKITPSAERICHHLKSQRYRFATEKELQAGIELALKGLRGSAFSREVRLNEDDIIDFLTDDGVGIEVKVGGAKAALLRQIRRYSEHASIKSIVVVSSRAQLCGLPSSINGKSVTVCHLVNL